MKYIYMPLVFTIFAFQLQAQWEKGEPILKVFANYHQGITDNDRSTAFEIKRIYLGYRQKLDQHFSAEVKLDVGSPEDLSQFSLIRRYAYFKTAALYYNREKITVYMGLFDMKQFGLQEDIWGYRYLYKSFQDEYKYGPSADIGAGVTYRINDFISTDLVISNGEGYKNLQSDDIFKFALNTTIYFPGNIYLKMYVDQMRKNISQRTYSLFLGTVKEKYRLGAEYNYRENDYFIQSHNLKGISVFGTYIFNKKWEIYARYDKLNSNLTTDSEFPWNINNDGSAIISGLQYIATNGVKFSFNYRDWYSFAANGPDKAFLYLNLEFKL